MKSFVEMEGEGYRNNLVFVHPVHLWSFWMLLHQYAAKMDHRDVTVAFHICAYVFEVDHSPMSIGLAHSL